MNSRSYVSLRHVEVHIAAKEAAKAAEDKAQAENVVQSGKVVNMNTNMFAMQV